MTVTTFRAAYGQTKTRITNYNADTHANKGIFRQGSGPSHLFPLMKQAQNLCITAWVKESKKKFNKFKQIETKFIRIEQEESRKS